MKFYSGGNGKRIGRFIYFHKSLIKNRELKLPAVINDHPNYKNVTWNVIKVNVGKEDNFSLLLYKDFYASLFPSLISSCTINLKKGSISKRHYDLFNPPILHRKELLISRKSKRYIQWRKITAQLETLGLFDNSRTIGRKQNWDALLLAEGCLNGFPEIQSYLDNKNEY